MPLPAGIVKVYQRNSENKLQLTASSDIKELAVDETFEIGIGTSSDVKAERTLVKSNRIEAATQGTPHDAWTAGSLVGEPGLQRQGSQLQRKEGCGCHC